ncbi:hypothetical protein AZE42_04276 [Rhizopogon vesiculosus]|uniref:Zinc-finger domain-containing protein n=1 Tax=Rhizopogon vesiculosus TaxID=180088 RepID=A0A1J8PP82_9AGAM|nr:hypothetical protein AZE42_04276 [Rhizopogon vesiculosus]
MLQLTPAHASYSSTTRISPPQHSDEQDSDCYIIPHHYRKKPGPRVHMRASIAIERVSSIDTFPAAHPFHTSVLDPQMRDMNDPSATDDILTDKSYPSLQHTSHSVPASPSHVGSSSLRDCDTPILSRPKLLPSLDDVIEIDDDDEEDVRDDVIEISSDSDNVDHANNDEEMAVDHMLTKRVSISPEPSSSPVPSLPSSFDMTDPLFTPPPSRKCRRRVILDHVSVPPFPKGLTTANYKPSSNVSSRAPQQGVEYPSVGDALAAAFAQNDRSPSPSLDRKGKRRARETTPTAPVTPKRKSKHFAEGVSTAPTTILNAHYPPIELEIPDFVPYFDTTWHRNTYWIERIRLKRYHTELQRGLPELVAQMKSLGGPGNEQKGGPILPRVFAPLFERRADIAASLAAQWEYAASPEHIRRGKSTKISETQNTPSSSNYDPPSPVFANDNISVSHFTVLEESQPLDLSMEMDQYFNDFGNSPARTAPNAYCSTSHLNSFLHDTTQLPPDVALGERDHAADGFLGIPPSPRHEHNLPSPMQSTDPYLIDHSRTLDGSFKHVFPEDGTWSRLPDVLEQEVVSPAVSPPDSTGTIDPSLLSGNEPPPKPSPSPTLPILKKKRTMGPIIYVRRPPGVSASQDAPAQGKARGNVQIKYRMSGSASPMDEDDVVPNEDDEDDAGRTAESVTAPPAHPGARPNLKIRIRRSGTRASSDGSFVPSQPSTSASPVVPNMPLPEIRRPKVQEPAPTLEEKDDSGVLKKSFCHQCRNTTKRPKMRCSKRHPGPGRQTCGKLFCNRCILNRYPEHTFVRLSKTFVCPVCTDTCNCSACARRRGEEYISMRGGGFAGSPTKSGIVLVPDVDQPQDIQTIPELPASAPQTMFWAHVYGLEGERVGRAFVGDTTAPKQPTKVHAPNVLSKSKLELEPKPKPKPKLEAKPKEAKPRIFIGLPLREWKVRTFRDLEPCASILPPVVEGGSHVGKGKGKAVERPRMYIGDARWLHVPYARMPVSPPSPSSRTSSPSPESELELDSDGSLTSLEDLEEVMDWPQPDVGEAVTVTWESVCERSVSVSGSVSASLSPEDLEKAIGFALATL